MVVSSAQSPKPLRPQDRIESTEKSLRVLEAFSTERQGLNATMAAERAGLSRAAARRHLLTLAELGYLEESDGHYWLAPKVLRLASSYLASAWLPRLLQPSLNRLGAQTRLVCSVAIADVDGVVIIARSNLAASDKATAAAHGLHLGNRAALHTTSTGRIFLAQKTSAELGDWLAQYGRNLGRLTAQTLTKPDELRAAVKQASRQDWAYVAQENELGVHAVAVPLRDTNGHCVAAMNAVASVELVARASLERQVLPLLQAEAQSLRALLRV